MTAATAMLLTMDDVWGEIADSPYVRGVVANEAYRGFWSGYSLRHRYDRVEVPSYFMTGWYDSLLNETLRVFRGWRLHARSAEARTAGLMSFVASRRAGMASLARNAPSDCAAWSRTNDQGSFSAFTSAPTSLSAPTTIR